MADIHFDLQKSADAFVFELGKKGINTAPIMRVAGAIDISGSMDDELRDGSVQKVMDQLGGITIVFDDNGEIDMWKFDDRSDYIGTWKPSDYRTYIKANRISSRGGTAYSPFINDITDFMFKSKTKTVASVVKGFFGSKTVTQTVDDGVENNDPVLALIVTDGEPNSERIERIREALTRASSHPIFFAFVGLSNQHTSFPTLEALNREYKNVGFIKMKFGAKDEDLYEQIITDKLVGFLKQFSPATV